MSVQTPNMLLIQPTIGVDSGLTWEQAANANSSIIDGHNHTSGYGVQIPPAGLNINSDLTFQDNNATNLRSVRFYPQASPIGAAADLGCLYESGVDLWYNDGSGNQIQLTAGGSVNATSSGISSGTATASFVSSVLVVNAATNTPANIQVGSVLLGNNSAGSKFLTLAPPSSMAANYTLTLPSVPGSTLFVTLDTSGNLGTASSIQGTQIAAASLTGAQLASQTVAQGNLALRATGTTVAAGGVATSSSCGSFTTTGTGLTTITNFSLTITTTGRPVVIGVQGAPGLAAYPAGAYAEVSGGTAALVVPYRGTTPVCTYQLISFSSSPPSIAQYLPGIIGIDFPAAGTYTYTIQVNNVGGGTTSISNYTMFVYEM
jgi:hypothetical protein